MYINQLLQVPIKNVSEKQASKAQCKEASATMTTTSTRTAKKQQIGKTTILPVCHAFLYISSPSLQDYDVKMPKLTF